MPARIMGGAVVRLRLTGLIVLCQLNVATVGLGTGAPATASTLIIEGFTDLPVALPSSCQPFLP